MQSERGMESMAWQTQAGTERMLGGDELSYYGKRVWWGRGTTVANYKENTVADNSTLTYLWNCNNNNNPYHIITQTNKSQIQKILKRVSFHPFEKFHKC